MTSATHLTAICAAVDIPVNADFEDGFAHEPDKVGVNVARAVKTGVAGLSIEDFTGDNAKPLFDRALAVDRIRRRARRSMPTTAACCSPAAARRSCAGRRI